MAHTRKPLFPFWPLLILTLGSLSACVHPRTLTPTPVEAKIDVMARTITPDPLPLRYEKANDQADYAVWKMTSGQEQYDFSVQFKPDLDERCKPHKHFPPPTCTTAPNKQCQTIPSKKEHKGCHKYSVIVSVDNKLVVIDPQVNVDP